MKVLWLSATQSLFKKNEGSSGYNGGGWISSLQKAIEDIRPDIELGIAFTFPSREGKTRKDNITYYPILQKKRSPIKKLLYYWGGYKKGEYTYLKELLDIVRDFSPDVIQLFGLESTFAFFLKEKINIPVVVHLQGLLNMSSNAFYPQEMNRFTFYIKHLSMDEWIIRNGYNFAANKIRYRSKQEILLFQKTRFFMGRTDWDFQMSRFFSPDSEYFHIDEILRDEFYTEKPWEYSQKETFVIISTISQTIYKGLDVILKTAQLLTKHTNLKFEWRVIGVNENSKYVRFFEKNYGIKSKCFNVKYIGSISAGEICKELQQSHVYVHPSYIDNSPNSLCEAQLIGLPTIGTFVGGIPSLIAHQKNGLLVPANAPYETAYWIQYLYNHPDMMSELGKNSRETALLRHSRERIVTCLAQVYEKLKTT